MRPAPARRRVPAVSGGELERRIVEALRTAEDPLGAYELLDRLDAGGPRYPTSIYRALDRLCARRVVERVELRSAYRLRARPGAILVTCAACGHTSAEPADEAHRLLSAILAEAGYVPDRLVIEAVATCARCLAPKDDDARG